MKEKKVAKKVFKVIGIVLLVAFVVFMISLIRKLIIIKSIQSTASQYTSSTNYHVKSVSNDLSEYTMTIDSYAKGDKKLLTLMRIEGGEVANKISTYYRGERQDIFYESPDEKKADLDTDDKIIFIPNLYDYFDGQSNFVLFCSAISSKIDTVTYNGKECYRVSNFTSSNHLQEGNDNTTEVYIDKDTGLVVRTHFGNSISEREYEFDNVSDEVFIEPDIGEYEIMKK